MTATNFKVAATAITPIDGIIGWYRRDDIDRTRTVIKAADIDAA